MARTYGEVLASSFPALFAAGVGCPHAAARRAFVDVGSGHGALCRAAVEWGGFVGALGVEKYRQGGMEGFGQVGAGGGERLAAGA